MAAFGDDNELPPSSEPVTYPALASPEQEIKLHVLDGSQRLTSLDDSDVASPVPVAQAKPKPCLVRALGWYAQPLQCTPRTFLCALFHVVNLAWTMTMGYVVMACLAASLSAIVLACVGLPLTYLVLEMAVGFAWLDIGITYHMVDDDPEQRANGRPRMGFKRPLPEFCSDFRNRAKSLLTDVQLYATLFYQLIAKPVVTFLTCWTVYLVVANLALVFFWVGWFVQRHFFLQHKACIGSETCVDDVCTCHGWTLDTLGDLLVLALLGLLMLPLTLRLSNFAAWCSKCTCYFFLTDVYNEAPVEAQALLGHQDAGADTVLERPVVSTATSGQLQQASA